MQPRRGRARARRAVAGVAGVRTPPVARASPGARMPLPRQAARHPPRRPTMFRTAPARTTGAARSTTTASPPQRAAAGAGAAPPAAPARAPELAEGAENRRSAPEQGVAEASVLFSVTPPASGTPAPAPLPRHRAAASPAQDGAPASSPRMRARERPRHAPAAQTVRMPRGEHFAAWLRSIGHVSHTSTAYEHGFTKRDVAEAVASGGVGRVRRAWLA